jgi:protease II
LALLLDAPFVDVLAAMLDPSLLLTTSAFEGWGTRGQTR